MVVIWTCICASLLAVSSSAPIAEDGEQESGYTNMDSSQIDYLRGKRLNNNVYTITPCAAAAAAAAANIPIARSPEMAYANFAPPEARYYVPSAYYDYSSAGYAGNMYRVEDPYSDTREMLRYSDTNFMEQVPAARFAYRTAPSSYVPINTPHIMGNLNGQYNMQTGSSASTYGIFPSGSVGNCNLPLLFSCSPSVVTGQMMKPESQVYGHPTSYSSGAISHQDAGYGGADGHYSQRIHANQEQAMYENSAPVKVTAGTHSNEKST